MQFVKEDLQYHYYDWSYAPSDFGDKPTRRAFDRYNGHQVLFIINYYGLRLEDFTKEHVNQLEIYINSKLPMGSNSELTVYNWLCDTFIVRT